MNESDLITKKSREQNESDKKAQKLKKAEILKKIARIEFLEDADH